MTDSPVTKTAEQVAADALNELWCGDTFDGSKWSADSHEAVTIATAFRNAGLLVSGAPSEEQAMAALNAMYSLRGTPPRSYWDGESIERMRAALTAVGVGSPVPVQVDETNLLAFLESPTHAPPSHHSGADGSCIECPWQVGMLPGPDLAKELSEWLRGGAQ